MQERLDKWRKNILSVSSSEKVSPEKTSRRAGKGDYGDVVSVEQWEEETMKSQTRR